LFLPLLTWLPEGFPTAIALNTGLRIGEISFFIWSNVDCEKDVLNVFAPKTGKIRVIRMNSETRRILETWVNEMCKLLNLEVIPASDCACEDGRLKFQIEGVIYDQWATISFGIEEKL
jgi:Phage integrase family